MGYQGLDFGGVAREIAAINQQGYQARQQLEQERMAAMMQYQQQQAAAQRAEAAQQAQFAHADDAALRAQQYAMQLQDRKAQQELAQLKTKAASKIQRDPVTGELIDTAAPKPAQFTAAGFANRAELADKQFRALQEKGFNPSSTINRINEVSIGLPFGLTDKTISLPNELASAEYQQARQARDNFISAVLRKESGAAIGKEERAAEEQKYFDQPGDSKEVSQQKALARQAALASLSSEAGPALPLVQRNFQSRTAAIPREIMQDANLYADVQEAIARAAGDQRKVDAILQRALGLVGK